MLKYEIKKVFSRTSSRITLLLLFAVLGISCYFAVHGVTYVNSRGEAEYGISAARKLRGEKEQWEGPLTEDKIRRVIEENNRINNTQEANSKDIQQQNIAYSWKQGFSDIRQLITYAYCGFQEYDYYKVDSLSPEDARDFYSQRTEGLKTWLNTDAKEIYTDKEKAFILEKYNAAQAPLIYKDSDGWQQLFEFAPTVLMVMVLILGYLTAGIFSCEFQLHADSVFYTSTHGRGKAVIAKVKAGFLIVSGIYWLIMCLYTLAVLGILGGKGWDCMIQSSSYGWKSFYNITYLQEYLLIVLGGYVGTLFITFMTMLVSAKTKSAVVAVTVPFILIFIPSFLAGINIPTVGKILGLMPDQLLQINVAVRLFNLYNIGSKVTGALLPLFAIYTSLTALSCPLLYQVYRKIR